LRVVERGQPGGLSAGLSRASTANPCARTGQGGEIGGSPRDVGGVDRSGQVERSER
jgi:hypothetical protein